MVECDLLFPDDPNLNMEGWEKVEGAARPLPSNPQGQAGPATEFITHLHKTLNAPNHLIRNRLLRLTADSPDILAVVKAEGKV